MDLKEPELDKRYTREVWLHRALELLSREGQSKLRTERLAQDLGVTRGSFYHHFKNRDDFVLALTRYWAETFTVQVNALFEDPERPPDEALLSLMRLIRDRRLDRYDIAFRSWAAQEPLVAAEVRKVDDARYGLVRQLFSRMGFKGHELEERVRVFLVYESAQHTVSFPSKNRSAKDSVERRFRIYTQRCDEVDTE